MTTVDWGIEVTLVELKDIQLPVKRAMALQAEMLATGTHPEVLPTITPPSAEVP